MQVAHDGCDHQGKLSSRLADGKPPELSLRQRISVFWSGHRGLKCRSTSHTCGAPNFTVGGILGTVISGFLAGC
jgi:hypothetical protein